MADPGVCQPQALDDHLCMLRREHTCEIILPIGSSLLFHMPYTSESRRRVAPDMPDEERIADEQRMLPKYVCTCSVSSLQLCMSILMGFIHYTVSYMDM